MSYSKARWNAANCIAATTGGKIRANAHNLRRFYEAVAEHGGYGRGGWVWSTAPSAGRKLAEQLVAKELLVKREDGSYVLAPEQQAQFDGLVVAFQRQEAEKRAAEQAATQAAFEAHQAAEAQRQWAVMVASTMRTYGTLHGKVHQNVFTGPEGKAQAEVYAAELRAVGNNVTMVFEITEDVHGG